MIPSRLSALREMMQTEGIHAFIIPGTDPHMSEYIAQHWKCRDWISGFDGSAGTILVTLDQAGLWTDSRYFLQGAQQLEGTTITLFKEGLPETPSMEQFLIDNLKPGQVVAVDGNLYPIASASALSNKLAAQELSLRTNFMPFDAIWTDRPALPKDMAFYYPVEFNGESFADKRARVLNKVNAAGADAILLTALDDIAWTLNLRGTDVECNPVAICYVYMDASNTIIFIDNCKVTAELNEYFQENQIQIAAYEKVADFLAQSSTKILLDPNKVNQYLADAVSLQSTKIITTSPVALLKAVKNETEIAGFRRAMIKDGVALTRFFRWLEQAVPQGGVTECSISDQLTSFREEQEHFVGESFSSIVGYKGHGAIVHYRANEQSDVEIKKEGMLLIDSGGQYFDGTTDITRTVFMGEATEEQRRHFTLVLKGHIQVALCRFPQGTRGDQMDILARQALWNEGLNYLHGTGHGIGHFLNVHEGPQSIRLNHNPTLIEPGMVTSNEPGLYITDQYGIRLENLILAYKEKTTPFGDFYAFETLTLFPFDLNGVVVELLSPSEITWLNEYHQTVYDRLSPELNSEEQAWLKEKTRSI